MSIRSSHSLSSLMNTAVKHPEMNQPGLNASIVETVSADFSGGHVSRSTVTGELALVHNLRDPSFAPGHATIRLENFPVLEKVAPNPAFITQLPSRSGEYSVDLSQISRTSIGFKYKVHLEPSQVSVHAPISLVPSWKIEPTQASVILSYSFNPAFASPLHRSLTLHNVVVLINVEKTRTLSCLSKPVGAFSKEKSMIYWKLGDIRLDAYSEAPQKLLARFSTDAEAQPGTVEVRWEISGEHAVGLGSGLGLSVPSGVGGEGGRDPFADEGLASDAWKAVGVMRRLISGKYVAN
jgi:F-BAR domain only protein